jgi:hypothetical protein
MNNYYNNGWNKNKKLTYEYSKTISIKKLLEGRKGKPELVGSRFILILIIFFASPGIQKNKQKQEKMICHY